MKKSYYHDYLWFSPNLSAEEFFLLDAPSVPNLDWEMKPVVVSS